MPKVEKKSNTSYHGTLLLDAVLVAGKQIKTMERKIANNQYKYPLSRIGLMVKI